MGTKTSCYQREGGLPRQENYSEVETKRTRPFGTSEKEKEKSRAEELLMVASKSMEKKKKITRCEKKTATDREFPKEGREKWNSSGVEFVFGGVGCGNESNKLE